MKSLTNFRLQAVLAAVLAVALFKFGIVDAHTFTYMAMAGEMSMRIG